MFDQDASERKEPHPGFSGLLRMSCFIHRRSQYHHGKSSKVLFGLCAVQHSKFFFFSLALGFWEKHGEEKTKRLPGLLAFFLFFQTMKARPKMLGA